MVTINFFSYIIYYSYFWDMTSSAFIISTSLTRTNLYTNSNMTPRPFTITNMPMVLSPPEGSPFDIATDNQFVVAKEELNKNDVNNNKEFENSLHTMSTLETRPNSLASTLKVEPHHERRYVYPAVVGHRGSIYQYPENTIRSFLASYESGSDAVELDVFLLKCGTLVVFHGGGTDENPGHLQDYCNVDGVILDYTAIEAREQLQLNSNYAEFPCPKDTFDHTFAYIPTLEEVLYALKDTNTIIKIELKGVGTTVPVLNLVERMDMVNQCHFSSFAHERIALVRQLHPERNVDGSHVYQTGALYADEIPDDFLEKGQAIGADEIHLKYDTCTKDRVDQIRAAGMKSMCWFRGPIGMKEDVETKYNDVWSEDAAMYDIVMRTGVDAMCVNKPGILAKLIAQKKSNDKMVEMPMSTANNIIPMTIKAA